MPTRHKLTNQGIQLTRRLDPGRLLVLADATQLEQAFLNLTLNAVEAMPAGGKLTVSTGMRRHPRKAGAPTHAVIEFKDTGHGMSEEQRSRMFSSLLSTTKAKGTGLGLAIVAKIVEAHQGKIEVKTSLGRGTSIALQIPLSETKAGTK